MVLDDMSVPASFSWAKIGPLIEISERDALPRPRPMSWSRILLGVGDGDNLYVAEAGVAVRVARETLAGGYTSGLLACRLIERTRCASSGLSPE